MNNQTVRHLLGISGGKDSAALAIYLKRKHPDLDVEYYFTDTGKELDETYQVIESLEVELGKKILIKKAAQDSPEDSFDHFLAMYGGYLPSSNSRWCTKKLKLDPFEEFAGEGPAISYVGIRGDEDRDGYISRKTNIQSIFPFRRNMWSEEVVKRLLANDQAEQLLQLYKNNAPAGFYEKAKDLIKTPLSLRFNQKQKLNALLDTSVKGFNEVMFAFLKAEGTGPVGMLEHFPLIDNEDNLVRSDIFKILEESGVGIPKYYQKREFTVDGETGYYARSRSGCFFCFFQQKIEWVWLLENHTDLFKKAMAYEKDGYSWMDNETLAELAMPARVAHIKKEQIKKIKTAEAKSSPYLLDNLIDGEGVGCAACFI